MRYIKDFTCFDFNFNYSLFSNLKSVTVYDDELKITKEYKSDDWDYWDSYIYEELNEVFGYYPESRLVLKIDAKEFELYRLLIFLHKDIAGKRSKLSVYDSIPFLFNLADDTSTNNLMLFLARNYNDVKLVEVLTKHPDLWSLKGDILTVFSDFELKFKVTDVRKFNTLLSKLIMLGV